MNRILDEELPGLPAEPTVCEPNAGRRILICMREWCEGLAGDLVSTWRAWEGLPRAISELAAELLAGNARYPDPHAHAQVWEAPKVAYLLTAAVADSDHAEADALWKPLDKPGQVDLLLALAAQLKVNLLTALSSAADTDSGRYGLAWALAQMSVHASTAEGIPRNVFAETCRNIASRSAGQ